MNPDYGRKDLSTNNRATKAIDAMPITGILLAAVALLSGFSSVIGSETAIAQQQNMTGANATGNQTATSSNQTGAPAASSGGSSNNAGTAGSYYP